MRRAPVANRFKYRASPIRPTPKLGPVPGPRQVVARLAKYGVVKPALVFLTGTAVEVGVPALHDDRVAGRPQGTLWRYVFFGKRSKLSAETTGPLRSLPS